jgi:formate--tetrahydrofolate ligase
MTPASPQRKEQAAVVSSQHKNPKSDIEIAQAAKPRPIMELARDKLGVSPENLEP